MAKLSTAHTPELKGLYANSNRFTVPPGSVPRLSNLYMVRRGAFHTVPGSKWVSSFDGLAPHVTTQQAIVDLDWYSPSQGGSPARYLTSIAATVIPGAVASDYILGLQLTTAPTGCALMNFSGATSAQLAIQQGAIGLTPNADQTGDFLIVAFGENTPPNIFPTVTQIISAVASGDTTINVQDTTPFANSGFVVIDNEIIQYTSKTATSFAGCTRGAGGTAAASHTVGTNVFLASGAASVNPVTTTTTGAIISTDTTVNVASTAGFYQSPPPPPSVAYSILIDSEVMTHSGQSPTSFTGLIRGSYGTTPAGHANGAAVFQLLDLVVHKTTLTANITNAAATIPVGSTGGFPTSGLISVDAEVVAYTGVTANSFTGCTRGQAGTTAVSHNAGAFVFALLKVISATGLPWGPIVNTFDPTIVYTPWPGTAGGAASTSVSVNIGSVIYQQDGAGVFWLFRAQNSGVTGYGANYPGPQFFAQGLNGGGFGTDGAMTAGSATLTATQHEFTASLVGKPILVRGAGPAAADLLTTVITFTDDDHLVLAQPAGTNVSGAQYIIGVGHVNDVAHDTNPNNNRGTVLWLNIGQAALSPPGVGFVIEHLDSLYLWGVGTTYGSDGITGPDALWQSDVGIPMQYNAANTTFVGKGDGTSAQGAAVYALSEAGIAATPQLVLFKDSTTYSLLNALPTGAIVQISGGLGCIAPSTIQFIGGYGVMRLSYAGVTLFDGQLEHVTEYTDAIRGYLFGGLADVTPVDLSKIQSCVSTQSVNPPFYMFFAPLQGGGGKVTRGFGYDFGLKQWFIMDLPFAITAAGFFPQSAVALVSAYQSLIAGLNDGTVRRIFAGDPDWDGTPINWSEQLPAFGFPGTPVYVRRVNPRVSADGGGATPSYTAVTLNAVRRSGTSFSRPLNVPNSLVGSMDVGEIVLSANLTIAGKGQVLIEGSDAQTSDKPMARVGT